MNTYSNIKLATNTKKRILIFQLEIWFENYWPKNACLCKQQQNFIKIGTGTSHEFLWLVFDSKNLMPFLCHFYFMHRNNFQKFLSFTIFIVKIEQNVNLNKQHMLKTSKTGLFACFKFFHFWYTVKCKQKLLY